MIVSTAHVAVASTSSCEGPEPQGRLVVGVIIAPENGNRGISVVLAGAR